MWRNLKFWVLLYMIGLGSSMLLNGVFRSKRERDPDIRESLLSPENERFLQIVVGAICIIVAILDILGYIHLPPLSEWD